MDYTLDNLRRFYTPVHMPGGYTHDLPETLRGIELYYNSKYKTGLYDKQGHRKFFYNIVKPACDIATKFIDLDTKDIILHATAEDTELELWLAQLRLKQWMKEKQVGELLNEESHTLPKYGHFVIKKSNEGWGLVNIINLRLDPSVKRMKDSDFVYEVHFMSKPQMEELGFDLTELTARKEQSSYLVYECYHKSGKGWNRSFKSALYMKGENGSFIETPESQINNNNEYLPPVALDESKYVDDLPYRELKWEDVPGRWLGLGFVEYLEDNQIAMNETENLERKGLKYKALQLWWTNEESLGGSNVFSDADNGDFIPITGQNSINPLVKDNSDLSALNNSRQVWTQSTERKTFTTDITTGADLPSRTPLGVANLQASLATSFFERKRENFGMFVRTWILKDVLPDFDTETDKEHLLIISRSEDGINQLMEIMMRRKLDLARAEYANRTGFFPSDFQLEELKERVMGSLERRQKLPLKMPKSFYRGLIKSLDVLTTGEQIDSGTQGANLNAALQILSANPGLLQNKTTRAVFFELLSLSGISPVRLKALTENPDQTPVPQGGSVSPMPQASIQPAQANAVV